MKRLMWTAAFLLLASSVWAQSLAEVARKEKERRKKVEASETHSYTDNDLRYAEGPMTQVTGQSTTASSTEEGSEADATAAEGESEAGAAAAEDPTRTEAYWRERLQPVNDRIRELEAQLQRPEYNENMTGGAARQRLEQQLEQARSARQTIIDEGRRAGVPPGWLR